MEKLHLDSVYRNRWEEFYLANGTVEDSRIKNWRQVAWDQVVRIVVHIKSHVYEIDCKALGFRAFMNFRWGGYGSLVTDQGKVLPRRDIDIWTVGWTDGKYCFLRDIDVHTGEHIKNYVAPLSQFIIHLHPAVRERILGD